MKFSDTESSDIGLSNHRLHHMTEISRENGKKVDLALMKTRPLVDNARYQTSDNHSGTQQTVVDSAGENELMK